MPIPTSEQIDAFEAAPAQIAAAIEGLKEAQLQFTPNSDEWSIHEVLIHLPDSEAVGFERIRKTLAEEKPILSVYDEDAWAKKLSYSTQDLALAMSLFAALRRSTASLLRSLPTEAWERVSIHPVRGELTLYAIFKMHLDHGNIHLAQIERLKQAQ